MKRFLTIVALSCVLFVPTMAGEIPTSGAPAPSPPTPIGDFASANIQPVPVGDVGDQLSEVLVQLVSPITFLAF